MGEFCFVFVYSMSLALSLAICMRLVVCWVFVVEWVFLSLGFLEGGRYSTDIRGNDKDELMNKRACNRGGKPVWWGLFRVWFGLLLNFNK